MVLTVIIYPGTFTFLESVLMLGSWDHEFELEIPVISWGLWQVCSTVFLLGGCPRVIIEQLCESIVAKGLRRKKLCCLLGLEVRDWIGLTIEFLEVAIVRIFDFVEWWEIGVNGFGDRIDFRFCLYRPSLLNRSPQSLNRQFSLFYLVNFFLDGCFFIIFGVAFKNI